MSNSETTKIWKKHFGNSASVPFGANAVPFFKELCDSMEEKQCQEIADRAMFGLASQEELEQKKAIMKSYYLRNGREMIIIHKSRD